MLLGPRLDLPLDRDESARFIPWIIALMVYLACLALAGALLTRSAVAHWSQGLSGSLTVQILPAEQADAPARAAHVETVLALLRGTPGVADAEPLTDQRMAALLEPWLGRGEIGELPLPALIDVHVKPGAAIDLAALGRRLAEAVPGTLLDDHQQWLERAVVLAHSIVFVAGVVLLLVGAAAALVTVFGTRTSLAIHRGIIEVMHLIGAQDNYVARQFEAHALRVGLIGGITGLLGAVVTLLGLRYAIGPLGEAPFPAPGLSLWQWAALSLLPLASALIAMLTARVTVLRTLARMV
jgi:cell division transport system permease protein